MKAQILCHETNNDGFHWYFCRVETRMGTHFFQNVRRPTNPITIDVDGYAHCVYDAKKQNFWLVNKSTRKEL